jgi:hypothetical protein
MVLTPKPPLARTSKPAIERLVLDASGGALACVELWSLALVPVAA